MTTDDGRRGGPPVPGVAFALAQIGAHASALFARRIAELELTAAQAGLLRMLAMSPGRNQREIAADLGMPPSRFVPFADQLDERGLIERRKNPDDRRQHALYLTDAGRALLGELAKVGAAHEQQISRGLSADEHDQLLDLLLRIAYEQGLTPGVHPGYRGT
ncbi:DNA-binding MarR family transcriptional regulator [Catenulispora sp. GAS73]|uniref:MarR family winged helix-turn-helix transcriptional regulator n=1 Tax=Catenulispora sp. GAS73 TaxID=3156269 RepID=UPI0035178C40